MLALSIIFRGLIPFAILFFAISAGWRRLNHAGWWFKNPTSGTVQLAALWQAIGVSAGVGLISFFAPMLGGWTVWLSIPMFLLMAAVMVNLFLWWRHNGSSGREMIPFVIMAFMATLVMGAPASVLGELIKVPVITAIFHSISGLAFWVFIGFMVASTLFFHYRRKKADEAAGRPRAPGERAAKTCLIWGIVAAVIFGAIFVLILISAIVSGAKAVPASGDNTASTESTERTESAETDWEGFWREVFGLPAKNTDELEVLTGTSGEDLDLDLNREQPTNSTDNTPVSATLTVAQAKAQWHFRHDDVIADNYDTSGNLLTGDALKTAQLNDYDFGHSVLSEAIAQKLASGQLKMGDVANKTERELFELVGADSIVGLMVDAMVDDPALGAAVLGYHDAMMHTREFLGEFFSEYQDKPDAYMTCINALKDKWTYDKSAYYEALNHYVNIIYTAESITIDYRASGIDDQMYQVGARTLAENATIIPDDIVMTSYDHSGYFITFTYPVKETQLVKISYRIDCGFQPCNVAEVLETTPQANPNGTAPTPTPTNPGRPGGGDPGDDGRGAGGNPGDDGRGAGGNPNPDPTPSPTPSESPKDVNRGTPITTIGVNDTSGPGPDTNNGVGAMYSSVQEPTGSTFIQTYPEYEQAMTPVLNNPGQTAQSNPTNAPTYTPPTPPQAVDNNGNSDTGYGGANAATPVQPADGVDTPNYDPDASKVEWGGPPA